ncbi:MAG: hypothetical protein K5650_04365 [Bacteroidales bacterium]|nr:hypothetical protein [Bacteroidales bacterium]
MKSAENFSHTTPFFLTFFVAKLKKVVILQNNQQPKTTRHGTLDRIGFNRRSMDEMDYLNGIAFCQKYGGFVMELEYHRVENN